MHVEAFGAGSQVMLLLHGMGATGAVWRRVVAALDGAWDGSIVICDLPGHGASAPLTEYSYDSVAAAVAGCVPAHQRLIVAGHSFGGLLALTFAAEYPQDVAGVVLLDSTHPGMFSGISTYPAFYEVFRRVSALFPSLARFGVGRLAYHSNFDSLPPADRDIQFAFWCTARHARSSRDEWAEAPRLMRQAASLRSLGSRPGHHSAMAADRRGQAP